jgi:murein L,D-transpeptidase YcbB/YkuD
VDGRLIEKGSRDSRVPLIRQRLRQTGDLAARFPIDDDRFDGDLEAAVARFQDRHRINLFAPGVDDRYGAPGAETRQHMSIPADQLIERIRINLERGRWVKRRLPRYYLVADIADFSVSLVESDRVVWQARSQVGDEYRKTPVFQSAIKYMEINPR